MTAEHWDEVARIFVEGILTRNATFETEVPSREEWDASHLADHRIVAVEDGWVLGWVAVSPISDRCAYQGVVEDSVYVAERARGRGLAFSLLNALVASTEACGIWTIQTGIFPENEVSIAVHEKAGFRRVGVRERIGQLDGVWRDVVLMERRSALP